MSSAKESESNRSVRALHLFKGAQTETVRLRFDASASFKSLNLPLIGGRRMQRDNLWLCPFNLRNLWLVIVIPFSVSKHNQGFPGTGRSRK